LEYTLTFDPHEHQRALDAINRILGYRRWTYFLAFGMPTLLSGLPILAAVPRGEPVPWGNVNIWAWLLFPGLAFWALPALTRWQLRRTLATSPTLQGTLRRVLNEQGVEAHGTGAATTVAWHAVQRVEETPDFLFLFYSKNCAIYLPKRILGGDLPQVRDYIATHMRSAKGTSLPPAGAP